MHVSVIFSTYNSPRWLEKVLWGFDAQSFRDFEIVVADDGSGVETRQVLDAFRAGTDLEVRHVWQPDEGFRKCRVLNLAVLEARGEYLVFTDGDCIPRRDFLEAHVERALPGTFLSGGYTKLPLPASERITREDVRTGRAFELDWLRRQGLGWSVKNIKLAARGRGAALINALTPTRASWNGHNASTWAELVRRVNGFDERLHYGGEDREFGERLVNAGVRSRQIRYHAICVHLDHRRSYVRPELVARNREIRRETRRTRATAAKIGLRELAASRNRV